MQRSKKCCVHATVVFNNQIALKSIGINMSQLLLQTYVTPVHESKFKEQYDCDAMYYCIWTLRVHVMFSLLHART